MSVQAVAIPDLELPAVLGGDESGVVEVVGPGVPRVLSHVEAAAIPLAGGTAWEAIVGRLAVRPGETVLVHAGAGGVGTARAFGRMATVLPPKGELTPLYQRNQQLHGIMLTRERRRLEELTPVFERRQARPVVEEVLPLEQVRKAHERLDSGPGRGKTILDLT
jgi:NADPH:quinone reductase-like Zn-dependent oxidoreductase